MQFRTGNVCLKQIFNILLGVISTPIDIKEVKSKLTFHGTLLLLIREKVVMETSKPSFFVRWREDLVTLRKIHAVVLSRM